MLRADEVSFRCDPHGPWVLESVTLAAAPGQVTALRGPNGRGKTTLARLLAGYLAPQQGPIALDGAPLPRTGQNPVQLVLQHPEHALDPR